MPRPTSQPSGVRLVRTIAPILSLIVANVWPGAMIGVTGGAAVGGRSVGIVTSPPGRRGRRPYRQSG